MNFAAKAKEINAQMDLWIQKQKQQGTWETNAPIHGQEYYASLVAEALRECREKALCEAAHAVNCLPKRDNNDHDFSISAIDAIFKLKG